MKNVGWYGSKCYMSVNYFFNANISKTVKFFAKIIRTKVFCCFMENIRPGEML